MAKLRKALAKPEDWQRHMRVLERLAAPKVVVRPKKRKPVRKMSFSAHKSILIDLDKSGSFPRRVAGGGGGRGGGNSDDRVNLDRAHRHFRLGRKSGDRSTWSVCTFWPYRRSGRRRKSRTRRRCRRARSLIGSRSGRRDSWLGKNVRRSNCERRAPFRRPR